MSEDIILTLLIPSGIVGGTLLVIAIMAKAKKRRIRRSVEQGLQTTWPDLIRPLKHRNKETRWQNLN
jgi:hypothetical protein